MTCSPLPSDDLPSFHGLNNELLNELDEVVGYHFYEKCHPSLQTLLSRCIWRITTQNHTLTLRISCPSKAINWQILKKLPLISFYLAKFSENAQITVYPVPETETPWTVKVREGISFA
jgi:hypothetical protein